MNTRLELIRQRRAMLIVRSAAQRAEVVEITEPWRAPLSIVDRVTTLVQRVRAHPLAIPMGIALLFSMGRNRSRTGLWLSRIWTVWQLFTSLQNTRNPRS